MSNIQLEDGAVNVFDFSSLEELDPSLTDGYRVLYDREVPLEIRHQNSDQVTRQGSVETLKVKLLILGSEGAPKCIRLEASSEADLFFHYVHVIEETGYKKVQDTQKLM